MKRRTTRTKATITSWTFPSVQWLECVCKMMWERPFAKQREGRSVGEKDWLCTTENVYPEAGGLKWHAGGLHTHTPTTL